MSSNLGMFPGFIVRTYKYSAAPPKARRASKKPQQNTFREELPRYPLPPRLPKPYGWPLLFPGQPLA